MSLQITTNLNVDFHNNKYILINAKQYDDVSRWISITCYDQGSIFNLNANNHTAYIRYRKADGNGVLNSCRINKKGEVLVELTEQMLAAIGICYVDLIIVEKGTAIVDINTGEIITVDGSPILSTMAFCINVYEASFDNSLVESSYEYNALNDALQMANAEYSEVIRLAKSYAVGDAGNIRENEDNDNAKYYCEQASISENNAKNSETNAKNSEVVALASEQNAKTSEINAKSSEVNAAASALSASESEFNAAGSADNAILCANNASTSEANAYHYYVQIEEMANGLGGSIFMPMGTVEFSELANLMNSGNLDEGYLYNVVDSFITDETFRQGAGVEYPAGTSVYYTKDGTWDCLIGAASLGDVATVDEVADYLTISRDAPDYIDGVNDIQEQVDAINLQLTDINNELDNLGSNVNSHSGQLTSLNDELNSLKSKVATNQEQLSTHSNTLNTYESQINTINGTLNTHQSQLNTINGQLTGIDDVLAEILS